MGQMTDTNRFLMRGKVASLLLDLHRAQFTESGWSTFLRSLPESAPWRRTIDDDEWIVPAEVALCEEAAVAWLGSSTVRIRGELVAEFVIAARIPGIDVDHGVEGFLRTVSTYWSWIHRGNTLNVERLIPGEARLRMDGPIPYPEWATTVAPTLLRRAMQLTGAEQVEIEVHPIPDQGLRFELRWRER